MKETTNPNDNTENIKKLFLYGVRLYKKENFYKSEIYEEAIKIFTEVKNLDTKHEKSHNCEFHLGVIHIRKAEAAEDILEKKQFYKIATNYFQSVKDITRTSKYNDIDLNLEIGKALYAADEPNEARNFLKNTEASNLIEKIEQEQGIKSNELVLCNQESYYPIPNITYTDANNFIAKVNLQEKRLNRLEQRVDNIENTLQIAGIYTLEDINKKIEELKEKDNNLYIYYESFNSGLQDIYIASCAVNSGLVVPNAGQLERIKAGAIEKAVFYIIDALTSGFFIAPISAVMSVGRDAAGNMFNSYTENNLVTILKNINIIIGKKLDTLMSIEVTIQQLALLFTHIKEDEILNIKAIAESEAQQQNSWVSFLKEKIRPTHKKIFFHYNDSKNDSPVVQLAFKDLTSLLSYTNDNAKKMLENPQSFTQQVSTVIKEKLGNLWEEKVKNNPLRIEYNLAQLTKKLPEGDVIQIRQKIANGKWENTVLSLISIDWTSIFLLRLSFKGLERGVKAFSDSNYYNKLCAENNSNIAQNDFNNFLLFILHETCKNGNTKCIEAFSNTYPNIVAIAEKDAPELFVSDSAIKTCIKDIERQNKTIERLNLKSSDQFVEACLNRVCPKLAEYKKNAEAKRIEDEKAKLLQAEAQRIEAPAVTLKIEWSGDNAENKERVVAFDIEDSPRSDVKDDVPVEGNATEYNTDII